MYLAKIMWLYIYLLHINPMWRVVILPLSVYMLLKFLIEIVPLAKCVKITEVMHHCLGDNFSVNMGFKRFCEFNL